MKRNKIKGFTLIECLVSLAILGIGSLIMAQIYANVSRINRNNHIINTSLSYQMKCIEEYDGAESSIIKYNDSSVKDTKTIPPAASGGGAASGKNNNYVKLTSSYGSKNVYSYSTDIYVLLSRDANDKNSSDAAYKGETEDNYAIRYKYIYGHKN